MRRLPRSDGGMGTTWVALIVLDRHRQPWLRPLIGQSGLMLSATVFATGEGAHSSSRPYAYDGYGGRPAPARGSATDRPHNRAPATKSCTSASLHLERTAHGVPRRRDLTCHLEGLTHSVTSCSFSGQVANQRNKFTHKRKTESALRTCRSRPLGALGA